MSQPDRAALAATVHDPDNNLLAALHRAAPALREVFGGFGILATAPTSDDVVRRLEALHQGQLELAPGLNRDLTVVARALH